MEIRVYCPKCRAVLSVPMDAAGKIARCPTCGSKFQVPGQTDVMEETVSSWIEQDVEDMQDEFDQLLVEKSAEERRRREARESEKARIAAEKMDRALQHRERMQESTKQKELQQKGPATVTRPGTPTIHRPGAPAARLPGPEAPAPTIETPASGRPESPTAGASPTAGSAPTTGAAPTAGAAPTIKRGPPSPPAPPPPPAEPEQSIALPSQYISDIEEEAPDESIEYPMTVFVDKTFPHLVVAEVSQAGVLIAFDSSFLEYSGFRLTFPTQCVFSGHAVYHELVAKPLGFFDQSQGELRNAQEIESGREVKLVSDMTPRRVLGLMRSIAQLPGSFKFPMPYYVSADHVSMSMTCTTAQRADDGVTCYVLVPTGGVALQWVQNVNGICGDEVRMLHQDVKRMWSNQWQLLPEIIRQRLSTWVQFQSGESFQYYFNDAQFGKKDEGLAGVVLTDCRLIFHKYHRKGSVNYVDHPKMVIRPDGDFAGLTVDTVDGSFKAAQFRFNDLDEVMQNMREVGLNVEMYND